MKIILTCTILAGSVVMSLPVHAHDVVEERMRTLPVTATAEIQVPPDVARITTGVLTQDKDASDAAAENAAKMYALYNTLRNQGVGTNDIKTSQLSLSPRYDYESKKRPVIGYTAENIVTITTYDLAKVGPIIDAVVAAGSNNIRNVQFSLRDPETVEAEVLDKAIRKARLKAQNMATSAGVSLGSLQSLNVNGGQHHPFNQSEDVVIVTGSRVGGGAASAPTPVSYGDQTVRATVNLVYEMR